MIWVQMGLLGQTVSILLG
uniref:Uncharacterized protein n=1 Tax=Arundo donax TaxID=35708 RepID=A0A0A9ALY8_ARUDO